MAVGISTGELRELTDEELNGKFLELAEPVIGVAAARHLLEQLWVTDKLANVDFDHAAAAPARAAV